MASDIGARWCALTRVAVALAEPLRAAVDAHGPGCPVCGPGRLLVDECPEAARLWALLPDGDRVAVADPR